MPKARLFAGYPKEYPDTTLRDVFTIYKEPGTRRTQMVEMQSLDASSTFFSGVRTSNIIIDSRFPVLNIDAIYIGSVTIPATSFYRTARYTIGTVPNFFSNSAFIVTQNGLQVKATEIVFSAGGSGFNQNAFRQVSIGALNGIIYADELSITQGLQIPSQTLDYVVVFYGIPLP